MDLDISPKFDSRPALKSADLVRYETTWPVSGSSDPRPAIKTESYLGSGMSPDLLWERNPAMLHSLRVRSAARRRVSLGAEPLEHRTLLSGSSISPHSKNVLAMGDVAIVVPSTYVSQRASQLDVTLERAPGPGRGHVEGPLTVDFTAALGSLPLSLLTAPDLSGQPFTPVAESVTFPASQTTVNVVVPINPGASNPGLVPIALSVESPSRPRDKSSTTVYLASDPSAVPPSIVYVHMIKRGIAVTFSKPMAPATVKNVHNYAVKYSPSQQFSVEDLTGVGLINTLNTMSQPIALKRAVYDASTDTVTLIPKVSLPASGTYQIKSPASLAAKLDRPYKAQPLTDLDGNVLNSNGMVAGAFSISISKGRPYVAAQPTLSDGS